MSGMRQALRIIGLQKGHKTLSHQAAQVQQQEQADQADPAFKTGCADHLAERFKAQPDLIEQNARRFCQFRRHDGLLLLDE